MRIAVLVLAALALVTTSSAAPVSVQAPVPGMVVMPLATGDVLVAWTPMEGATAYVVLRGETPDAMEPLGVTSAPYYLDATASAQPGLLYAVAPLGHGEPSTAAARPPPDSQKCGVVHNGGGNAQVYASGCFQGPT